MLYVTVAVSLYIDYPKLGPTGPFDIPTYLDRKEDPTEVDWDGEGTGWGEGGFSCFSPTKSDR